MVICGTDLFSSLLPYVHVLSSSVSTYCSQCLNLSNDLKRCSQCRQVFYCSVSCQRQDWIYHRHECAHLPTITDEHDLTRLFLRLIIRYKSDHGIDNPPTKRQLNDLQTHENEIRHDRRRYTTFQSIYQRLKQWNIVDDLDENLIFQHFCRLVINTLTIHDPIDLKSIGYGLYFDATVYNHSCFPTCHTIFNGKCLSVRTIASASADGWTINYIDLLETYKNRQEFLRENYYFNCQCKRCLKNDPNELILLEKIHHNEQQMDKSISKADYLAAYQYSKNLCEYYDQLLPYYHAYVSLHHVKHLKLELLLLETVSHLIIQSTMATTCQRVQISMGGDHPLTREAMRICEEYRLEMTIKQTQITS
ncbi:unnamed protein product [Adineta ricciae]|uniref:MYND-type domain-containing protein n=1 Tax=Adineta ricciae TaxID=249248 RepID=A0A816EDE0_ADIRI|nr:unnamed protein product [Adineta ricciae]